MILCGPRFAVLLALVTPSNPLHLYHVFSSFNLGGLESRTCAILNSLGDGFRHTITAMDGKLGAVERISPGVRFEVAPPPPGKGSLLYPLRLSKFLRERRPDLLITYNWGAFDAVMAATVGRICPVIHAEDGFNPDEASRLKKRRVLARRLVLNRVSAMVVPSQTLHRIAVNSYGLRKTLVHWIPNGIPITRYGIEDREVWRAKWGIGPCDFLIGSVGRLSPEKNLGVLLRAVAACDFPNARVAIVGDGATRAELETLARNLGLGARATFAGFLPDPSGCYGAFDLFAMSSTTEQMPIALLEAMATGLPALCTTVGDSAEILGNPGWPATVTPGDQAGYAAALRTFYENAALRAELGARNRARSIQEYSFERMIGRYRDLYLKAATRGRRPADCLALAAGPD
jgi:glycosyltransferase involved in cell wall biosynthesis